MAELIAVGFQGTHRAAEVLGLSCLWFAVMALTSGHPKKDELGIEGPGGRVVLPVRAVERGRAGA